MIDLGFGFEPNRRLGYFLFLGEGGGMSHLFAPRGNRQEKVENFGIMRARFFQGAKKPKESDG